MHKRVNHLLPLACKCCITSDTSSFILSSTPPPCFHSISIETTLAIEIEHVVRLIVAFALVSGITFFVVALAIGYSLLNSFIFFIGIAIANVPDGLLPAVTVCTCEHLCIYIVYIWEMCLTNIVTGLINHAWIGTRIVHFL